ncbi:MAG TPA: hypothetical protein VLJ21_03900 [Candidatus Binatia bacterium]|nr:hypothetical protein [Candidatus Binatia bacterium]
MTRYYHGTSVEFAFHIAEAGAILSPWEQKIQFVNMPERKPFYLRQMKDAGMQSLEELALLLASGDYPERDKEKRVKCVSLTTEYDGARSYADQMLGGQRNGAFLYRGRGVVLGIDHDGQDRIAFVPRKVSLNGLKDVHILGKNVTPLETRMLRHLFAPYQARVKRIR